MLARSQKRWIASARVLQRQSEAGVSACVKDETGKRLRLLTGAAGERARRRAARSSPSSSCRRAREKLYDLDIAVLRFADPQTPGETPLNALADEIAGRVKLGPAWRGHDGRRSTASRRTWPSPMPRLHLMSVLHSYYLNRGWRSWQ